MGWLLELTMTADELIMAGERINNLARVINIREGGGSRERTRCLGRLLISLCLRSVWRRAFM